MICYSSPSPGLPIHQKECLYELIDSKTSAVTTPEICNTLQSENGYNINNMATFKTMNCAFD